MDNIKEVNQLAEGYVLFDIVLYEVYKCANQ